MGAQGRSIASDKSDVVRTMSDFVRALRTSDSMSVYRVSDVRSWDMGSENGVSTDMMDMGHSIGWTYCPIP